MKKTFIVSIVSVLLAVSAVSFAKPKGIPTLIGAHDEWTHKLVNSKEFAKKTVLVEVGDQKKSTTMDALLKTVEETLSLPQHSIFVDPILLAEHQNVGYATIEVDGAIVKSVTLSPRPPAEQVGVAALVLSFKGDTTLPTQVIANLQTK